MEELTPEFNSYALDELTASCVNELHEGAGEDALLAVSDIIAGQLAVDP